MSYVDVIEFYKKELQRHSLDQLRFIPEPGVWSLGQMYDHLIEDTHYYLDQVEKCASANDEIRQEKTEGGEKLFESRSFPPIKIKGPGTPSNPENIDDLMRGLNQVLDRMSEWDEKIDSINPNFKERHDGFGWLNAREWFELVGMHFRHHLRQKDELDQMLKN
ncbi:DinB family protein [Paenibacillus tyrfis]|uniref:DinB family protein n=1 Tax=Paenibacillus tyrfis TaxID=1501230 RepID=UPI000B58C842|nr:DinB family protein [Paenibacillus tyrfis]